MPIKVYKPTSAGRRGMSVNSFDDITCSTPERSLVEGRVNKWLAERVLLEQGVFGEKETVEQKLGAGSITRFVQAYIGD